MKKNRTIFLFIGLSALLMAPAISAKPPQTQAPQKPLIGYIKNEDLVDMCGCSFEHLTKTRGYTFASDAEVKTAWMNIDGEDMNLKLTHFGGSKVFRIGSRYTETFEADGVKAALVKTVTRVCNPVSTECETTNYNVTITVTKDGRKQTVKAKGQCGCV